MYSIIQNAGELSRYPKTFATLIIGVFLAVVVFNCFIIPVHNRVKYFFIQTFGDYSASEDGYCTMRPKENIHVIGLFTSLLLNIGFAEPAYYDTEHFRRPKFYTFIISVSGIFTYLAFFGVTFALFSFLRVNNVCSVTSVQLASDALVFGQYIYHIFYVMIYYIAITCIYSAIFNLIPAFPLDMGDALYVFMPVNWQDNLRNNELAISLGLFVLAFMYLGSSNGIVVKIAKPLVNNLYSVFSSFMLL